MDSEKGKVGINNPSSLRVILYKAMDDVLPLLEMLEEKNDLIVSEAVADTKKGTWKIGASMKSKKGWKNIEITVKTGKGRLKKLF